MEKSIGNFFRHTMPGLVFIIETTILLLLSDYKGSDYEKVKDFFCQFMPLRNNSSVIDGASLIALLLFGMTGLGYLFGSIYHTLYHVFRYLEWRPLILDRLSVIEDACDSNLLQLKKSGNGEEYIKPEELTQSGAWRITDSLVSSWNEKNETIGLSTINEKAHERHTNLSHIFHGSGANVIATLFAVILWRVCWYRSGGNCGIPMIFAVFFLIGWILNYLTIKRDFQGVTNYNIIHALQGKYDPSKNVPVRFVSKVDLKDNRLLSKIKKRL